VYLVKPKYPKMYLDSSKPAQHAVAWGASLGPKYYYGNKQETLWAQEIHKKAMNTQENLYLLQVEKGTHKSLPLYEKVYGQMIQPAMTEYAREPPHRVKGRTSGSTSRYGSSKEEQLHKTVNVVQELNKAILGELASVQGCLHQANDALNDIEYTTFGRTYTRRPQSAIISRRHSKPSSLRPRSAMLRSRSGRRQ